jgi:hypothetical protein
MPFLWLSVPDRAQRGFVERNSIATTSLRDAERTEICQSGLWNVEHVRHRLEAGFAGLLGQLMQQHR